MADQSRYCYPGTDVLINHCNIRDEAQLGIIEGAVTKKRLTELLLSPVKGSFDLVHLQEIHKHIFHDIYPFAGEIRTEDIAKDTFRFAPTQYIRPAAADLFHNLAHEKFLMGLQLGPFAERASHYMAEINVLHPFREGNGRTQREFIRQLADQAGYELDWSKVDKSRIMRASIRSKVDTRELVQVIRKCLRKKRSRPC